MSSIRRVGAVFLGAVLLTLGLATVSAPAQATGGPVTIDKSVCEATTLSTTVGTLVVDVNGEVKTGEAGETVEIGPFTELTKVYWRVFGGPERDHDYPLWNGYVGGGDAGKAWKASIETYAETIGNYDWTVAGTADTNEFVRWKKFWLKGCAPEPTPTTEPTPEPTVDPTPDPEPTVTTEPTPTSTETSPAAAGGTGGGNEKPGLPQTGSPLPILVGAGLVLSGVGGVLTWLFRRPKLITESE